MFTAARSVLFLHGRQLVLRSRSKFKFFVMENFNKLVQNCKILWSEEYEKEVINILQNWDDLGVKKKPRAMYNLRNKYVLKVFAGVTKVISKKDSREMATKNSVANLIKTVHESIGHKGEKKTFQKISETYCNIHRVLVSEFIKNCERCVVKMKKKEVTTGIVVRPILSQFFNERGQVDLVDFQTLPDGEYKWILHFQDHLSKYHFFRPLKTKTAKEVAETLLRIFIDFGAPSIL